jgi:hypothetical protein
VLPELAGLAAPRGDHRERGQVQVPGRDVSQVLKHQAGVDEAESAARRGFGDQVVPPDLEDGLVAGGQAADVNAGGQDVAGIADAGGQPLRDGASACAGLPATPAGGDTQPVQVTECGLIQQGSERSEVLVMDLLASAREPGRPRCCPRRGIRPSSASAAGSWDPVPARPAPPRR